MRIKSENIIALKNCPITGLPITTNPRWKYEAKDNSCNIEIAIIGDNILYELPVGIINEDANKWFIETANSIIQKHFEDKEFFIIFDYTKLKNAELQSKKIFYNWLITNSDQINFITVYGINKLIKLAVLIGHYITKRSEKLQIKDSYSSSIKAILENKILSKDDSKIDHKIDSKIQHKQLNKVISYLGRMTWTNDLNQEIPVLAPEDPFAGIFASVSANQENLRSLDNDIAKARLELERSIQEKEKSLKELKDNELVMLSIMEDIQRKEADTKQALEQANLILKGASIGWWDWDILNNTEIYNDIFAKNLGYKLEEITHSRKWWEDRIHPDDQQRTLKSYQDHLNGDTEYYNCKYRLKTKEGIWKWFTDFGQIVKRDNENNAIRMVGILKDTDIEETAKHALEQSEEYFRTIIENSIDAIIVIDSKGKILFQSESAKTMMGFSGDERVNSLSFSRVHPDDKEQIVKQMTSLLRKPNEIENIKLRVFHKDGTIVHVEGTAKNTLHSSAINGIIMNYRNVTKQVAANSLINKLSTAIDQTANTIVITDTKGNIEYINPQFSKKTGYTAEEVIGKNPRILNSGLQSTMYYVKMWETIISGKTWHGEFHNIKKNGELYWERVTISPIKEDGKIINYLAIKQDITKQKELEQKQNEDRYLLKQRINYISFTNELSTKFINISSDKLKDAINELLKITAQFTTIDRASLFLISDDKKKLVLSHEWYNNNNAKPHKGVFDSIELVKVKNLITTLLKNENYNIHTSELDDTPSNSSELELLEMLNIKSSFSVPIIIKDALKGFISFDSIVEEAHWSTADKDSFNLCKIIITNTLERIQSEQLLIIQKEKAEESNRLKTAFLNNMSHEIRTPLNGILGFLDIVADPEIDSEEKEEYIDIINRNSERLITTVTDIIDISKIEAGQIEVHKSTISINKLINELHLQFSQEASSKKIIFNIHTALSDGQDNLFTDAHKINAILSNLVRNALKYTEEGEITFGYLLKTDKDLQLLEFYVEDTGIGIPADRIHAIFNRFEQADISNTRAVDGSGLGLSISKAYAEMLNGKLSVISKEGSGSRFIFTIPFKNDIQKTIVNEPKKPINKYMNFKDLIVLVAEDEEINNLFFKVILRDVFKETIYVKTGAQAISTLSERPEINLILMDIKMPEVNGYEASREIKKTNKDVIIIAQTAHGFKDDKEMALEAGCDDYISKPMDKEDLFDLIGKYF